MTKKYFGLGVGRTREILTKFVFLTLKSSQISEIPQKLQRNLSVWVEQADTAYGAVTANHSTQIWPAVKLFNRPEFWYLPTNFQHGWTFSFLLCAGIVPNAKFFSFSPYPGWTILRSEWPERTLEVRLGTTETQSTHNICSKGGRRHWCSLRQLDFPDSSLLNVISLRSCVPSGNGFISQGERG